MERIFGKTSGLKAAQLKRLKNLYRRKVSANEIVTNDLTRAITALSHEIKRQIGLMITRKGEIAYVIVGDDKRIVIPVLEGFRHGKSRLAGVRCIHTHLRGEALSEDDITDLVLLGLDMMVAVRVGDDGVPGAISYAHILPENRNGEGWEINEAADIGRLDRDCLELIQSLEDELSRKRGKALVQKSDRAVLVGVTSKSRESAMASLEELKDLAESNQLEVRDIVIQHVQKAHPRFLIGRGKLIELVLRCLQTDSNLLIFDNELSPAQVKSLTDASELKIIDRSQLILDIFSRRAVTREGKIQVELAQLKYLLPRLATKNTAMSRLTGGIGGRGPGETKLEINRRGAWDRISRLNKELKKIKGQREHRRKLRNSRGVPVLSIVGYTNAGKSTLLNSLTKSKVLVENKLFATLDPSSRRLRFPREREVIITDTVGFIKNLPDDLMDAFEATLEELHDADLLIHLIDASSERMEDQIKAVEDILVKLDLQNIPQLLVLNKCDLIAGDETNEMALRLDGVAISALNTKTFPGFLSRIEAMVWNR